MSEKTESFNQNYEILKNIAETLRIQREPNIDELVPMIERATKAYKICQERLEAVKIALNEYLPPQGVEPLPKE